MKIGWRFHHNFSLHEFSADFCRLARVSQFMLSTTLSPGTNNFFYAEEPKVHYKLIPKKLLNVNIIKYCAMRKGSESVKKRLVWTMGVCVVPHCEDRSFFELNVLLYLPLNNSTEPMKNELMYHCMNLLKKTPISLCETAHTHKVQTPLPWCPLNKRLNNKSKHLRSL